MTKYGVASYDLYEIQELLRNPESRVITRECFSNAVSLGYSSEEEIVNRVLQLKSTEIDKTMESDLKPGLWQDVYHSSEGLMILYIKLQKWPNGDGVVIQLKKK